VLGRMIRSLVYVVVGRGRVTIESLCYAMLSDKNLYLYAINPAHLNFYCLVQNSKVDR
jgi:hypothetical protein